MRRILRVGSILTLTGFFLVSCTSEEQRGWESAQAENSVAAYEAFLSQFPESEFAPEAEVLLFELLPVIPFTSERDGNMAIYTMKVDGSAETLVSPDNHKYSGPALSPDGTRIAFTSDRDGNAEIYVLKVDGTEMVRLTDNEAVDSDPVWSPDGQQIAFSSNRDGNIEIYVMNADGKDPVRLTDHPGADVFPAWSPDGNRIAFTVHREDNKTIWIMSTSVADFAGSGGLTSIGPLKGDIFLMNADGSGLEPLVTDSDNDAHPAWSPDGQRIVFTSERDGNQEIYAINMDGSGLVRLTDHEGADRAPICYTNSGKIIFTSERDEVVNIFIMNADGTALEQLTEDPANDFTG